MRYSQAAERPPPLAPEPRPCPPGPRERLLHKVLGVLERPDHSIAVRPQLAPVALEQTGDSRLVDVHHQLRPGSRALLIGHRHVVHPPLAFWGGVERAPLAVIA